MSRHPFILLLQEFECDNIFLHNSRRPQFPVATQLGVALYCLGRKGNVTVDVADRLRVSEGYTVLVM